MKIYLQPGLFIPVGKLYANGDLTKPKQTMKAMKLLMDGQLQTEHLVFEGLSKQLHAVC